MLKERFLCVSLHFLSNVNKMPDDTTKCIDCTDILSEGLMILYYNISNQSRIDNIISYLQTVSYKAH